MLLLRLTRIRGWEGGLRLIANEWSVESGARMRVKLAAGSFVPLYLWMPCKYFKDDKSHSRKAEKIVHFALSLPKTFSGNRGSHLCTATPGNPSHWGRREDLMINLIGINHKANISRLAKISSVLTLQGLRTDAYTANDAACTNSCCNSD